MKMAAARNFVSLLTFRRAANASRIGKAALYVLMVLHSHTQQRVRQWSSCNIGGREARKAVR